MTLALSPVRATAINNKQFQLVNSTLSYRQAVTVRRCTCGFGFCSLESTTPSSASLAPCIQEGNKLAMVSDVVDKYKSCDSITHRPSRCLCLDRLHSACKHCGCKCFSRKRCRRCLSVATLKSTLELLLVALPTSQRDRHMNSFSELKKKAFHKIGRYFLTEPKPLTHLQI
jgi:hypothetical protein